MGVDPAIWHSTLFTGAAQLLNPTNDVSASAPSVDTGCVDEMLTVGVPVIVALTFPLTGTDAPVSAGGKLLTPTVKGIESIILTGAPEGGGGGAPPAFFCGTSDITKPSNPKPTVASNNLANCFMVFPFQADCGNYPRLNS